MSMDPEDFKFIDETRKVALFQRKKLTLQDDPYLSGTTKDPYYRAYAEDEKGNEFFVIWDIKKDYDASKQDEGDACDWDNPSEIWKV